MEYNFQYLQDLYKTPEQFPPSDVKDFINAIDTHFQYKSNAGLLHVVPILYSMAFFVGLSVFTYKILN